MTLTLSQHVFTSHI